MLMRKSVAVLIIASVCMVYVCACVHEKQRARPRVQENGSDREGAGGRGEGGERERTTERNNLIPSNCGIVASCGDMTIKLRQQRVKHSYCHLHRRNELCRRSSDA